MDLDDFGYAVERLTRTAEDLSDRIAAGWTKVGEAFSGLADALRGALPEADHSVGPDDNPVRPIEMKRKRGWKRRKWN
jgi:hypothetical protein